MYLHFDSQTKMTFITKSAFKTSNENYSPCNVSVTKPFEAKKSNIDDKNNILGVILKLL